MFLDTFITNYFNINFILFSFKIDSKIHKKKKNLLILKSLIFLFAREVLNKLEPALIIYTVTYMMLGLTNITFYSSWLKRV